MAKLFLLLVLLSGSWVQAKSLQLELYAQSSLAEKLSFGSETVGGLSGFFLKGTKLLAVSDDRGKFGPPRFYEMDLKIAPGKVDLGVRKVHYFKNVPADWTLDLEGIGSLAAGDLVLSTEGSNHKKPRALPHVFVTSGEGIFKQDLPLPDRFLPERTGLQKKGIENNRGFEGLTVNPNGRALYILNESPIVDDQGDDDANSWLRLVEFKKDKNGFKVAAEYPYVVTRTPNTSEGVEVFRAISEILFVSEGHFLVLERGGRLTKKGLTYTGGLYLAETAGSKDVSQVKSLADGKSTAMKKQKLVDLEELLVNQKMENFEALAWGPVLPDGRKSLLVLSDNNFSAKEKTTLLVFAVKEVE